MSEQAEMVDQAAPAVESPTLGERVLTVQVERRLYEENPHEHASSAEMFEVTAWVDIATVPLKPRTPRRVVIAKALLDAGIKPDASEARPRVRVLDEESAAVVEPDPYQPPAEWRVS
jgi:hypothetical protein